jgi:hypothetical protein
LAVLVGDEDDEDEGNRILELRQAEFEAEMEEYREQL